MKSFPSLFKLSLVFLSVFFLNACGGPPVEEEEPKPTTPPTAIVETLPTPPPINKEELLNNYAGLIKAEAAFVKSEAEKAGIVNKIGQNITPDDLARFAAFFWAVDGNLRIAQLNSMLHYNRLLEVLKAGEPTPSGTASADPDQDNPSFLISQTITQAALVQRSVIEGLRTLGVKNVRGLTPSQPLTAAPAMMQELLKLIVPAAPETAPETMKAPLTRGPFQAFLKTAWAQATTGRSKGASATKTPLVGGTGLLAKPAFPPLIRLKIVGAPLLLARAMTYDVDGKLYVLHSSLKRAQPEFQALPAEQFVLKAEKQIVGSEYRNALEARLNALGAVENRTVAQWWEAANLLAELKLAYPLVDLSKEAESLPATQPAMPGLPPATLPSAPSPGPTATQPSTLPPMAPMGGVTPPPAPGGAPALETKPAPSPLGVP